MEPSDLDALGKWVAEITHHLSAGEMRALSRRVGTILRAANAKREKANKTPEGGAMAPRKAARERRVKAELSAGKGAVRKKLMFQKIPGQRFLKTIPRSDGVDVGFVGAIGRIARVHQYGLRDKVSREPGAKMAQYAERPLLGDTEVDREAVLELVYDHLSRR